MPQLAQMGVLTKIDQNALARYCTLWARWRKAEASLAEHGETFTVKDQNGKAIGLKPFPQVKMASQLAEQLLRLEQQFGLTPSARTRIEVTLPAPENNAASKYFVQRPPIFPAGGAS